MSNLLIQWEVMHFFFLYPWKFWILFQTQVFQFKRLTGWPEDGSHGRGKAKSLYIFFQTSENGTYTISRRTPLSIFFFNAEFWAYFRPKGSEFIFLTGTLRNS